MKVKNVRAYLEDIDDVKSVIVDKIDGLLVVTVEFEFVAGLIGLSSARHSFTLSEKSTLEDLKNILDYSTRTKIEKLGKELAALEELNYNNSKYMEFLYDNPDELRQYSQ